MSSLDHDIRYSDANVESDEEDGPSPGDCVAVVGHKDEGRDEDEDETKGGYPKRGREVDFVWVAGEEDDISAGATDPEEDVEHRPAEAVMSVAELAGYEATTLG